MRTMVRLVLNWKSLKIFSRFCATSSAIDCIKQYKYTVTFERCDCVNKLSSRQVTKRGYILQNRCFIQERLFLLHSRTTSWFVYCVCLYRECRLHVLQCIAVCRSVLQCVACVAACRIVLSVLQCVQHFAVHCSALQCVAIWRCLPTVCCSVLQRAPVCCSEVFLQAATLLLPLPTGCTTNSGPSWTSGASRSGVSRTCMCIKFTFQHMCIYTYL